MASTSTAIVLTMLSGVLLAVPDNSQSACPVTRPNGKQVEGWSGQRNYGNDALITQLQVTGLIFPTPGCWEVTGRVAGESLTFVTRVEKIGEGPTRRPTP